MIRVASIAVAILLLSITLLLFPPVMAMGDLGLCLPSPNQWLLPKLAGWSFNTVILLAAVVLVIAANKRYNFVSEADPVTGLALLLLTSLCCLATCTLTTSVMLLLANCLGLYILLSTYGEHNASKEFFIIGTLPAIGAMFQYSFLIMIPVFIGGGLLMKSFRLRELVAFIFGLAAPYWISVGLGWIAPGAFRIPEALTLFNASAVKSDIFITILATGLTALAGFILMLYNGVRLFTRNSRLRCMHMAFNLMGIVAIAAIIVDFDNFLSYYSTLSLWLAIQTGAMISLYEIRRTGVALTLLAVLFLPFYILAL